MRIMVHHQGLRTSIACASRKGINISRGVGSVSLVWQYFPTTPFGHSGDEKPQLKGLRNSRPSSSTPMAAVYGSTDSKRLFAVPVSKPSVIQSPSPPTSPGRVTHASSPGSHASKPASPVSEPRRLVFPPSPPASVRSSLDLNSSWETLPPLSNAAIFDAVRAFTSSLKVVGHNYPGISLKVTQSQLEEMERDIFDEHQR
jgi:hypothetical protein